MVFVKLGTVESGGWSDNCGLFSGQNIQNSWDSHAPAVSSFGDIMGDYNLASCQVSWLYYQTVIGQPIDDADMKGNFSPLYNA